MKKITCFTLFRLALAAALLSGLGSCIKSNNEDCVDPRGNVRLTVGLRTDAIPVRADETGYRIDSLNVYVFDADERYVTFAEGGKYTGQEYEFFLDLPAGDYHFVVWTNHGNSYKTNMTTAQIESRSASLDELELYLDHGGETLTDLIPDLLHGMVRGKTIVGDRQNHVEIAMNPATHTINMTVKGLPPTADAFDFTITDNHSRYTFDNQPIEGQDDFQYTHTALYNSGNLYSTIKTLTLNKNRHPHFVLTRRSVTGAADERIFDESLTQTILNAYAASGQTVDFETTHTFDIVLSFNANMGVMVSVNGWEYTQQEQNLE
jgi:hypothetical protein